TALVVLLVAHSEIEFQSKLQLALSVCSRRHNSKIRILNIGVRNSEDRSIGYVKSLGSELEPLGLGNRKRPEERQVEVLVPVCVQTVSSHIPESEGIWIDESGYVQGRSLGPIRVWISH